MSDACADREHTARMTGLQMDYASKIIILGYAGLSPLQQRVLLIRMSKNNKKSYWYDDIQKAVEETSPRNMLEVLRIVEYYEFVNEVSERMKNKKL